MRLRKGEGFAQELQHKEKGRPFWTAFSSIDLTEIL
jgi:hypothetical protein